MQKVFFLITWLVLSTHHSASAQDASEPVQVKELKTRVAQLQDENRALQQQLKNMQRQLEADKAGQAETAAKLQQAGSSERLADVQQEAEQQQERALMDAAAAEREAIRALNELREYGDLTNAVQQEGALLATLRAQQLAELDKELDELRKMKEKIQVSGNPLSASPDAVRTMAQRLAEAQIENRLRELEATAMLEAIELEGERQLERYQVLQAKARQLLEKRTVELQLMQQESDSTTELQRARSDYDEALKYYEDAVQGPRKTRQDFDQRLSEAAIELAVSRTLEKALTEEMANIRKQLEIGAETSQLNSQIDRVQAHALELRLAAGDERREIITRQQNEAARIQREVLLPLQIKLKVYQERLGSGHPSLNAIQREIELVERQLQSLKGREEAPSEQANP